MVIRLPISRQGYKKMREELDKLEKRERYEVVRSIERAREHGDLRENAEYHAAKERQSHVEGRILELKDKISRAEIIDCNSGLRTGCSAPL
jgi:transcription elongation factor GreA